VSRGKVYPADNDLLWSPLVQFVVFSERSVVLLQPLCDMCHLVEVIEQTVYLYSSNCLATHALKLLTW